jgi:hypothetical protein
MLVEISNVNPNPNPRQLRPSMINVIAFVYKLAGSSNC